MKYLTRIFFILILCLIELSATKINNKIASKMSSSSYGEIQEFAKSYKTKKNKISTAKAYGVRYFVIEDDDNTIVVIRGTANIRNAITDVMASETKFLNNEFILVHQGFYKIAKKLFRTIKLNTKRPVIIVGHSLGGAVSLLYGTMLYERKVNVELFTFGMPPIVNKLFLEKYKGIKHNRHFHVFDPVPTLSKPTIQVFQRQLKFKSFQSAKSTITNMIDTIQNIPDKYRHHGIKHAITNKLNIAEDRLKQSLFFKTCSLYFDYHKIDNYIYAIANLNEKSDVKNVVTKSDVKMKKDIKREITVLPSILKGTIPLEVEFYVNANGNKINYYYFDFAGEEILTQNIENNKVRYKFTKSGKHNVKIALKDDKNNIKELNFVVETREPTFEEYQETISKEFEEYKNK